MDQSNKQIFDFKKSFWKRTWNKIDYPARIAGLIIFGIFIGTFGSMRDGLRNNNYLDAREEWLKTRVRDLKNKKYAYLDEEDPPVPLKERTSIEQFRSEFLKIKDSVESSYFK